MMNHRFNLFNAGFNAFAPTLYYSKLALASDLEKVEDEKVRTTLSRLHESLQEQVDITKNCIEFAIKTAREFELSVPETQPATLGDYSEWLKSYVEVIESQFPMSKIDHYYFLYSRKISEILCNLDLIKCYADLSFELQDKLDLSKRLDKCVKDNEYILFKLVAAAALLSSEPRHNYFNVFYKAISKDFEPIKGLSLSDVTPERLQKMKEDVESYEASVREGYKKCIALLEELQV